MLLRVTRNVWASVDFATALAETIWSPPGLLTTITGCPQISGSLLARIRELMSVAEPGAMLRMNCTGCVGHFGACCAVAVEAKAAKETAPARTPRRVGSKRDLVI